MTQKEVRKQLNSLWVEVNTLENKMGYLPPVVDPNQNSGLQTSKNKSLKLNLGLTL